ncbi:MAG: hypothetical protein LBL84_00115 [Candidatus Nomurabacteria bacterium]|jgi:hypothetical protein|nr:hypothetical protein [Candidatus Nomurabacteria bacterium]
MRVVVVYKDFTEYAREVTDYLRDFKRITGHELETLDPDSIDGEIFCKAHDIVEYPSIVALTNDGQVHQLWEGKPLPAFNEVSYYIGGEN